MIVLTNGTRAMMVYSDSHWNDLAKYADHVNNGCTHAFRCAPHHDVLGDFETSTDDWTHDQVAAVAIEEVSISNEYT